MGLSNHLPSSRIAQAGVVADTASRPASPYEGQILYQLDTNQLLVWNGSAWVAPNSSTANPPGLELVKTQAVASGQTSVDVESCFSSEFKSYKIIWAEGTGNGNNGIHAQLLNNTTPANTSYYGAMGGAYYSGTAFAASNGNNSDRWAFVGHSTANDLSFSAEFHDPFVTKYTKFQSQFHSVDVGVSAQGEHRQNTSYNGIRLISNGGTFGGGTIRVYGYRN